MLYIDSLTAGQIAAIEQRMRPGHSSDAGFLAARESLRDVIERDAKTLLKHNLSHSQVAERILHFTGDGRKTYGGNNGKTIDGVKVTSRVWRGMQECPFGSYTCGGTNSDYTLTRVDSGIAIAFSGLMPHLIGKHEFFEGNTAYRVDPEKLMTVLYGISQ